jgi:hypothetical protein
VQAASRLLKEEKTFSKTNVTSLDWNSYPILRFAETPAVTSIVVQRRADYSFALIPAQRKWSVDRCALDGGELRREGERRELRQNHRAERRGRSREAASRALKLPHTQAPACFPISPTHLRAHGKPHTRG